MPNKFILVVVLIALFYSSTIAQSQSELDSFNSQRNAIQKKGMATLGIWSLGNMAWGGIGMATTTGSAKEFHSMNLYWNVVNLALATSGFIGAGKEATGLSLRKTYKEQQGVEKTFLINAGLDIGYMLGGLYLTERAKRFTDLVKYNRSMGYGNSFILQGGFLFLLDYTLFAINSNHGNKKLGPLLDKVSIGANAVGFIHRF